MQKTLEQVIEEYGVEERPEGIYIGAIDQVVPIPPKNVDMASAIDGIVRAKQRQRGHGATGGFPAQPVEASLDTLSGPGQLKGPVAGIARGAKNLIDFPGQVVDAFGKPPETGPERDTWKLPYGNMVVGAKRMITDPMAASAETARQSEASGHAIRAGAESLLSMIPGIGPWLTNMTERATSGGDPSGAVAEGVTTVAGGEALRNVPPEVGLAKDKAMARIGKTAATGREVTLSTLLKPNKKSFDFGADPIAEAERLPASNSLGKMRELNQANLRQSEAKLHSAAEDRTSAAEHAGRDAGIDVEPFIRSSIQEQIQHAMDDNNTALAGSLEGFLKARLEKIKRSYGGTYMDALQILAEKRALSADTKFAEDPIAKNMNVARMEVYKAMDGALDTLLPQAAEINKTYAGQIELDKLIEAREIQAKRGDLKAYMLPETAAKTRLNRVFGGGPTPGKPAVGGQTYEFFPRPKP